MLTMSIQQPPSAFVSLQKASITCFGSLVLLSLRCVSSLLTSGTSLRWISQSAKANVNLCWCVCVPRYSLQAHLPHGLPDLRHLHQLAQTVHSLLACFNSPFLSPDPLPKLSMCFGARVHNQFARANVNLDRCVFFLPPLTPNNIHSARADLNLNWCISFRSIPFRHGYGHRIRYLSVCLSFFLSFSLSRSHKL